MKAIKRLFKNGQRVTVAVRTERGWRRVPGVVEGPTREGTWLVSSHPDLHADPSDDGRIEATAEQIMAMGDA